MSKNVLKSKLVRLKYNLRIYCSCKYRGLNSLPHVSLLVFKFRLLMQVFSRISKTLLMSVIWKGLLSAISRSLRIQQKQTIGKMICGYSNSKCCNREGEKYAKCRWLCPSIHARTSERYFAGCQSTRCILDHRAADVPQDWTHQSA
jgi:hypothetical protein